MNTNIEQYYIIVICLILNFHNKSYKDILEKINFLYNFDQLLNSKVKLEHMCDFF